MSEKQKQEARDFAEAVKALEYGDRRYLEGWLDAKAENADRENKTGDA